jgi:hypothetical protein
MKTCFGAAQQHREGFELGGRTHPCRRRDSCIRLARRLYSFLYSRTPRREQRITFNECLQFTKKTIMRKTLTPACLAALTLFASPEIFAQINRSAPVITAPANGGVGWNAMNNLQAQAGRSQSDRFAYAITDLTKEGTGWNALRKLDLQTGTYSDVLLNGTDAEQVVYDAGTKKEIQQEADALGDGSPDAPFSTGVAAAAYDRRHSRLYYTPMFVDQLRYIDLKTMQVYYVTDQQFSGSGNMHNDEAKVVTRMVIAPDGYGYAINNDGTTFVRFSTDNQLAVENLGSLTDHPSNNEISIHDRNHSFGGDMISDDEGNLYILTARNHVFKVDTRNRVATHLGAIKNLPENFTVNGAVVNEEGALLVSSAMDASYYAVDPKNWRAVAYAGMSSVFRTSDLANGNYLTTGKKDQDATAATMAENSSGLISVYPNPVTSNRIAIWFNKVPTGDYTLQLTDMLGRSVMQRRIVIQSQSQMQELPLNGSKAKGLYTINVFDAGQQPVFTQKVTVQ